ncbi:small acid-soluble spore protein E (minor gamma-type SASP) [Pullulanibacillus pueri]|uniref:Small, acid-soluble spore protein gamma-type n=1 Tax=Pullulanibacillus pueri TaxID=1437324 RepID=A0A8J3ENY3_9BACL|nr:gamma-type small acid-soluble spore protein [Pullulanibacillus pueri]MBM7680700.1 small acid-soluble spore protein E (minor gamma-type SASP) [Pullulanibacillus pueri]GGH87544.1 hypothetical protein GCM10007096_37800 [Pullulanibacillus pueri]
MAKKSKVGTDVQQVKQQNQASASNQSQQGGAGQFQAEFGSETNAQQVRKQNMKSQQKKGKNQQ